MVPIPALQYRFSWRARLACPYFVPTEILNDGSWLHPARLPLGAGWNGQCCAAHDAMTPSDHALHQFCNLGNAAACPSLPRERDWDAVRFSVARAGAEQITLSYVCELGHAPVEHGKLVFDAIQGHWSDPHADARVQRLADCYLATYRMRRDAGQNVA